MNIVDARMLQGDVMDDLLGPERHCYVFLIGGGGKTTAMFALANALAQAGRTVITTTSTKILHPPPDVSPVVLVDEDISAMFPIIADRLKTTPHITVAKGILLNGAKLEGFSADELDKLREATAADFILVEADGAAGRPLKVHAEHEPIVSHRADLVIAVIGIDCIDMPLNDEHVHRAERLGNLIGRSQNATLTIDDIATLFFHPLGYLKAVGAHSEICVFLSKARSASDREKAQRLADALLSKDTAKRVSRIVIGDLLA